MNTATTTTEVALQRVGDISVPLPTYATLGAAGMDLAAALHEPCVLHPGERLLVKTGLALALPPGVEAQVRPRSGLALKHGVTVLNAPGTIDSDYRGELGVVLINHGREPFVIEPFARIAQLVFSRFVQARVECVATLPETTRGDGGYGSTG
ncbi:MAG: dUTP diphosphatase [Myxococcales bacterium]|nr:dUTP diphosphatase [Myxococcales bacterium]